MGSRRVGGRSADGFYTNETKMDARGVARRPAAGYYTKKTRDGLYGSIHTTGVSILYKSN